MPAAAPRPAQGRWRDVNGAHVSLFCRIEQVVESTAATVLPSRLHEQGHVVGRDLDSLYVSFQENQVISLRPHPVRVLDTAPSGC